MAAELRLAGATTLEEANRVLWEFLPRFNARFGVPPAQPDVAYHPVPAELDLDGVLCFKYQRTVAKACLERSRKDNTVGFDGQTLQLLPGLDRLSYAHARVEVQERLDGSLVVTYQGKAIASREAPPGPLTLRAHKRARVITNPQDTNGLHGIPTNGHREHHTKAEIGPDQQPLPKRAHRKPGPNHPWRRPLLTKSLNS